MPALRGATGYGESLPKIESLPEGTELEIVGIQGPETTAKNKYEYMTVECADGEKYFTLATGVRNKLKLAQDLVEKGELKFGADDPLTCRTTRYEAHGRTCCGLD